MGAARAAGPAPAPVTRTAAVVVPDWPLLAALDREERQRERDSEREQRREQEQGQERKDAGEAGPPVILLQHHRVTHVDAAAQSAGVLPGMRRRAAQAACPGARVLEADREHESSLFELVAAAVDTVAAGVDVLRPGVLLMSAHGPARHHGGEEQLAERIVDAVAELTGWDCSVGIADGPFAALLAARAGRIVRPGRSADYLAPHPVAALRHAPVGPDWGHRDQVAPVAREKRMDLAETVDLLQRLGITTLGDLAALPAASVTDRFGPDVGLLHLLATGREPAPPAMHHPAQPILVERTLETPLVRTDQAAFVARPMAEELQGLLRERGLVCTRLRIIARTEAGEEMERTWRHDGALSVADVVDRIRWQCDGWITSARLGGPRTGVIVRIGLHPLQLTPAGLNAPALWGSAGEAAQRASRAFARAQALVGESAVMVPAPVGGRLLREQVRLVPWRTEKPAAADGPWPGALPRPVPATVFHTPPPVILTDGARRPVVVTARGLLSGTPAHLSVPDRSAAALARLDLVTGRELTVISYGAPTLLDERWWSADGHRAARLQLLVGEVVGEAAEHAAVGPVVGETQGSATIPMPAPRPAPAPSPVSPASPAPEPLAVLALSREGTWTLEGIYD